MPYMRKRKYIPGESAYRRIYRQNHYAEKGLDYQIFRNLSQQNCLYCGAPPRLVNPYGPVYRPYARCHTMSEAYWQDCWVECQGIDKIDPQPDYTDIWNLVPCCQECNFMKGILSYSEFLTKCTSIGERHAFQKV